MAPDDDFTYFGRSVASHSSWPDVSAWGIAFRQLVAPHFAWSLAYQNDGHFQGHIRDGVDVEAWIPFTFADDHLTLSLGGGPVYYFDTENSNNAAGYVDVHGWALLLSADLRINLWSRTTQPGWFIDVRYDWSDPAQDIETHSIGGGIGYRMYADFARNAPDQSTVAGFAANEFVTYLGKTVVDSLPTNHALAGAEEYRRRVFWDFARASLAFVDEGDAGVIPRRAVIYEGWLEPSFWDGNASIGVGWGGYSAVEETRSPTARQFSYVVSTTISARPLNLFTPLKSTYLGQRLDFRLTWHRTITDYSRDTDIVLFGVGYRF